MERYEVPIDDRLRPLVEAAERGDEVVIVQDGREVARVERHEADPPAHGGGVFDVEAIRDMQRRIAALGMPRFDGTALLRSLRDEDD